MDIRFWGTRGSLPTPGPDTVRYGGNTSCVEIRSAKGTLIVIDCGTGARPLGDALLASSASAGTPTQGHVLIGHTHWDHIHGLPFFGPLFQPGGRWSLYGPRGLGISLAETLAGQMQYAYFPVSVDQLEAVVEYHDLVEGQFEIDDVTVVTHYLNHPALTLGFRIEVDGWCVVYASDHEPHDPDLAVGGDLTTSRLDAAHADFIAGADVLIHDAQYLASEYEEKRGWGHSTVEYVVDVARLAGVGRVLLHHHDPRRTDTAMDDIVHAAAELARARGYEGTVDATREGETLVLQPRGGEHASSGQRSAVSGPAIDGYVGTAVLDVSGDVLTVVRTAVTAEALDVVAQDSSDDVSSALLVTDLDGSACDTSEHDGPIVGITRTAHHSKDGLTDVIVWPSSVAHVRTKVRAAVLRRACRWEAAATPADEVQRLAALHALHVLDTPPEERFDRITRLACELLDVPIALVTLVDAERQWFKSKQGTDAVETHRDLSLCAHAILADDVFQVADLLLDDRFADNPAVNADHVRSYAGAPLILEDGSRVGTLCVADRRPRAFSEDQVDELRRLARLVVAELST